MQVEHLSSLVNLSPEHTEAVEDANRLQVINHTVNLDKRLRKLYELIENDLMGSLMFSPNDIAPFKVALSLLSAQCFGIRIRRERKITAANSVAESSSQCDCRVLGGLRI